MSQQYKDMFDQLDAVRNSQQSYSKEPNWMICIKGSSALTKSENQQSIKGTHANHELKNYTYIYDHQFSLSRGFSMESTTHALMPDGGITAQELKIIAPTSSIDAVVHEHFSQNTLLKEIHLIRIITVTPSKSHEPFFVTAEYKFEDAYISGLISKNDLICLSFRYAGVQYTKKDYNQLTGVSKGSAGSAYHNLVTGVTKAK